MLKRGTKKVLYVCPRVPYPPDYGYPIRALNVGAILSSAYEVDLLCISSGSLNDRSENELKRIFSNVIIFKKSPVQLLLNAISGFFRKLPIQVSYYYSGDIQKWIISHAEEYDAIICSTIRTAEYLVSPRITAKRVIDFVDSFSSHYRTAARAGENIYWRLIYAFENDRLLAYERGVLGKFDLGFITSDFDRMAIEGDSRNLSNKIFTIPNGVNPAYLARKKAKERDWVVFLGKMNYAPNEDAVSYFVKNVWPKLSGDLKSARFIIVGRSPSSLVRALGDVRGVTVTGQVKSPSEFMRRAKVVVAPLRFGGGIQNKVLEAMALGKAVVTTSVGARGIRGAKNGEHLLVVDEGDPESFARAATKLFDDRAARQRIGSNARQFILKNYTWDLVGKELIYRFGGVFKADQRRNETHRRS